MIVSNGCERTRFQLEARHAESSDIMTREKPEEDGKLVDARHNATKVKPAAESTLRACPVGALAGSSSCGCRRGYLLAVAPSSDHCLAGSPL